MRQGGDEGVEPSARRAADLEGEAEGYDRAADEAAQAGLQRRSRQFREAARASRKLAAETPAQAPALLTAFRARTKGARRRLSKSVPWGARPGERQTTEEEWLVERWLRKLRGP
ncbi:MAG: hypothetical protein ACJ76S_07870 [Solirubrobacteraceae bacterium]